MNKQTFRFSAASTDVYFDGRMRQLKELASQKNAVIITDENVFNAHTTQFRNWNTIVLKPGEAFKVQQTVDAVIDQLIQLQAHRTTTLIGVGGGVITDLTGYIASVYMRGIPFGFVPTSVLSLVDASLGGKNGIDAGVYKNIIGTIRQPAFILHDYSLLASLPEEEWINGFAEIIKHACILDTAMFRQLENSSPELFRKKKKELAALIQRNVRLKLKLVQQDEQERDIRKWLNFGHTLGHALENQYELSHGQAISIGMSFAAGLSAQLEGFTAAERLRRLLQQYQLPAHASFSHKKVLEVMQLDKKRSEAAINYVLLQKLGKAVIHPLSIDEISQYLSSFQ